ncbi:phage tail protein, partial [Enterobacter sp. PTB]|uniref:phage tail protein n=1 Tax=Enterobacter sp. PTB TaxID=3143437 RepID=UPI003DA7FD74
MKNIINPVDTDDGLFHDGNPATETEGTIVYARIMNDIQGATIDLQTEMQSVLTDAGLVPDPAKENQLLTAIQKILSDGITSGIKDGTTAQKGIVQLSSATDSDSETMAATPKAVKSVKAIADAALPATGNAASASKLQTARTIGGVSFDGTANINLPGVNTAGNQSTSGNAATATKLQTARTIGGVSFDGTANI